MIPPLVKGAAEQVIRHTHSGVRTAMVEEHRHVPDLPVPLPCVIT